MWVENFGKIRLNRTPLVGVHSRATKEKVSAFHLSPESEGHSGQKTEKRLHLFGDSPFLSILHEAVQSWNETQSRLFAFVANVSDRSAPELQRAPAPVGTTSQTDSS
jgi:hypothetical protein